MSLDHSCLAAMEAGRWYLGFPALIEEMRKGGDYLVGSPPKCLTYHVAGTHLGNHCTCPWSIKEIECQESGCLAYWSPRPHCLLVADVDADTLLMSSHSASESCWVLGSRKPLPVGTGDETNLPSWGNLPRGLQKHFIWLWLYFYRLKELAR